MSGGRGREGGREWGGGGKRERERERMINMLSFASQTSHSLVVTCIVCGLSCGPSLFVPVATCNLH